MACAYVASSEDSSMILHGFLHPQPHSSGGRGSVGEPQVVYVGNAGLSSIGTEVKDLFSGLAFLCNCLSAGSAENHQIQKGIGSQSVGSVNGSASSFTSSVQSRHDLILAIFVSDDLTPVNCRLVGISLNGCIAILFI